MKEIGEKEEDMRLEWGNKGERGIPSQHQLYLNSKRTPRNANDSLRNSLIAVVFDSSI